MSISPTIGAVSNTGRVCRQSMCPSAGRHCQAGSCDHAAGILSREDINRSPSRLLCPAYCLPYPQKTAVFRSLTQSSVAATDVFRGSLGVFLPEKLRSLASVEFSSVRVGTSHEFSFSTSLFTLKAITNCGFCDETGSGPATGLGWRVVSGLICMFSNARCSRHYPSVSS